MEEESKTIAISQPYFFPWIGLFEQIRLAEIFIFYDDVQFSKGHFQDRVQIKTSNGFKWMTVPKVKVRLDQKICEVEIEYKNNWKKSHIDFLRQVYKPAPYFSEMISIVNSVYDNNYKYLSELTINSILSVAEYYQLSEDHKFLKSSDLNIGGNSTQRVLELVKYFNANKYITGMGALNYFDFELFEKENKKVEFIDYKKLPYPQLYGNFNPYVSILDLIANTGKEGLLYVTSSSVYWKEFISSSNAQAYLKGEK